MKFERPPARSGEKSLTAVYITGRLRGSNPVERKRRCRRDPVEVIQIGGHQPQRRACRFDIRLQAA